MVRANTASGIIKVKTSVVFEGIHTPLSAELEIKMVDAKHKLIADKDELSLLLENFGAAKVSTSDNSSDCESEVQRLQQELSRLKLKEVERQQSEFE